MISKHMIGAFALVAVAGCKGSIEGAVYGTDDDQAVRVTDHPVFLLPASSEIASALKSACPAGDAGDWKQRAGAERARLARVAAAYADSARMEMTHRGATRVWSRMRNAMLLYRDSAARMDGQPPTVPGDLIEKLATKQSSTGQDGHYVFPDLEPGRYLVAVELRDEYRWVPVQVAHAKATADVRPRGSRTGCAVARGL